jgi:TolA-binding protein
VFNLVGTLYPQSYQTWYWLGETAFSEKNFPRAFYCFEQSLIRKNPDAKKRMNDAYAKFSEEYKRQKGIKND